MANDKEFTFDEGDDDFSYDPLPTPPIKPPSGGGQKRTLLLLLLLLLLLVANVSSDSGVSARAETSELQPVIFAAAFGSH